MARRLALLLVLCFVAYGKTAKLDSNAVFYEATGKGPQTLVLIHGWTCDHTFWTSQVPVFATKYKVLAIDLPGHGKSAPVPDYSMQRMARAVDAVMQKEKVARATLIGHSMAGAVILQFARLFPAKLERAVLVDALFLDAADVPKFAGLAKQFEGPDVAALRQKMVEGLFSDVTTDAVKEHIRRGMLVPPDSVAVGAMQGMFNAEAWQFTPHTAPALALVAPKNTNIKEDVLKSRFPNLTFRRMESGGHFFMMETPDVFNQIVLTWLSQN